MKDNKTKKDLIAQYKDREVIGGVYVIKNMASDKMLLCAVTDLAGSKNRFDFSKKTNSCVDMKLQSDWKKQGGDEFVFEILEELKKGDTQTDEEFKADIKALKAMWLEKLPTGNLY